MYTCSPGSYALQSHEGASYYLRDADSNIGVTHHISNVGTKIYTGRLRLEKAPTLPYAVDSGAVPSMSN